MQDITKFTVKTTVSPSLKHPISSPDQPTNKIPHQEKIMSSEGQGMDDNICTNKDEGNTAITAPEQPVGNNTKLQQVIGPLIKEFRLLQESVGRKYTSLETAIKNKRLQCLMS